jgi:outer membrane protein
MMKSFLPSLHLLTRWLAGGPLSAAGLLAMAPVQSDAYLEPLTNILSAPGSAGLCVVTRIGASPYLEGGNRYDVLPLYLYEGKRFFCMPTGAASNC